MTIYFGDSTSIYWLIFALEFAIVIPVCIYLFQNRKIPKIIDRTEEEESKIRRMAILAEGTAAFVWLLNGTMQLKHLRCFNSY